MSPHLESMVRRLRAEGVQFPVSAAELWEREIYGLDALRELSLAGLVQNPELYDGVLQPNCVSALEHLGVQSREHFRKLYEDGTITLERLRRLRLIGDHKIALILQWARVPVPNELKTPTTFMLSSAACDALQKLKKLMDLPSRDLVVECLIADALHDLEAEKAAKKK